MQLLATKQTKHKNCAEILYEKNNEKVELISCGSNDDEN